MTYDHVLWCEKYRPQTIQDCILPEQIKKVFQEIVDSGELPNLLFTGTAGLGKTTVARALCNELSLDNILINASESGNIDTLRGKIKQFASSVSLQGGYKVVILDEADYLNAQSTQPALRGFIEEFSDNCRFILTCNFKNKIIEPLHSRCGVVEFNASKKEQAELCGKFMKRVMKEILPEEGIKGEVNPNSVAELIMRHAPDWRRILNELQRSKRGDELVLVGKSDSSGDFSDLFGFLKEKDFKSMRKWVANNMDTESAAIFRGVYDNMTDKVEPNSIPQLVIILADYQHKAAFVADHELNMVACLTECMAQLEYV